MKYFFDALAAVRDFAVLPTVRVDIPLILAAIRVIVERKISFWDGLILHAAVEGGATVLYSEDLQHGQSFGSLTTKDLKDAKLLLEELGKA